MKHGWFMAVLLVAALLVSLAGCGRDGGNGIEGTWEAPANVIGDSEQVLPETGVVRFRFNADLSGKLISSAGIQKQESDFSYAVTEACIEIRHPSGETWRFPYRLEEDTLILTQNGFDIPYTRVK